MCDPGLCPDAPDDSDRCDRCPLDKLDAAQNSDLGLLLRRAIEIRSALKLGISWPADRIGADEFYAMLLIQEEYDKLERERITKG